MNLQAKEYIPNSLKKLNEIQNEFSNEKELKDYIIKKGNDINSLYTKLLNFFDSNEINFYNNSILKYLSYVIFFLPILNPKYQRKKLYTYVIKNVNYDIFFLYKIFDFNNEYDSNIINLFKSIKDINQLDNNSYNLFIIKNENDLIQKYIFLVFLRLLYNINENLNLSMLIFYIQLYLDILNDNKQLIQKYYRYFFLINYFYNDFNVNFKNNFFELRNNNDIYYKDINYSSNNFNNIDKNNIFSQNDINLYNNIMKNIEKIYDIKNKALLLYDPMNLNFLNNMIELYFYKNKFINNNIKKYKENLSKLEKEIIEKNNKNKYQFSFKDYKQIFTSFQNSMIEYFEKNKEINSDYSKKFNLYPYGSITELLNDDESDLDIYLDISILKSPFQKIDFLYKVNTFLHDNIDKGASLIISFRILVFKFEYKNVNCDLSVIGFCPYLHSNLIRKYSLLDERFIYLAKSLKYLLKILNIKNTSISIIFLNSFCWILILITFLQDILNPPLLPKLLSNCSNKYYRAMFGGGNREKNDYLNKKIKTIEYFINNCYNEYIVIPKYNIYNYKEIYKKNITKKNNQSLAEIFLSFLEFVIFYLKIDSIFVNSGYFHENFENKSKVDMLLEVTDEKFKNYYFLKYAKNEFEGLFLLRDPFDPHYNPGKSLHRTKEFFNKLKIAYFTLLEKGSFKEVIKNFKNKNINNIKN